MPVYKVKDKNGKLVKNKDGIQKYRVRVNYACKVTGEEKQLTRVAWGHETAHNMERALTQKMKNGEQVKAKKMTVQELFDEYMDSRQRSCRESTLDKNRREYRLYIQPTMENAIVEKITTAQFEKWKRWVEKKDLALQTRQHAYHLFRAFLNYGVKMGYIKENRLKQVGTFKDALYVQKEIEFYEVDEFKTYIEVARQRAEMREREHDDLMDWEYFVFFNVIFWMGLRKGECHGIRWSDIKNESKMSIRRSIAQKLKGDDKITPPKNKSSYRTLQMPAVLIAILKKHKERKMRLHNFNEDDLICGVGRSLRDSTVDRKNRRYAALAGLTKRITIHGFRHSHVSLLVNANVPIKEISRRVGHAKIEITLNTYAHLYKSSEQNAIDAMDKIMCVHEVTGLEKIA